jgi:hypothetical protein
MLVAAVYIPVEALVPPAVLALVLVQLEQLVSLGLLAVLVLVPESPAVLYHQLEQHLNLIKLMNL